MDSKTLEVLNSQEVKDLAVTLARSIQDSFGAKDGDEITDHQRAVGKAAMRRILEALGDEAWEK